jgi:hypothetical protein
MWIKVLLLVTALCFVGIALVVTVELGSRIVECQTDD